MEMMLGVILIIFNDNRQGPTVKFHLLGFKNVKFAILVMFCMVVSRCKNVQNKFYQLLYDKRIGKIHYILNLTNFLFF